jgi:hypothetical protein
MINKLIVIFNEMEKFIINKYHIKNNGNSKLIVNLAKKNLK